MWNLKGAAPSLGTTVPLTSGWLLPSSEFVLA
jgi:hypothetical protein